MLEILYKRGEANNLILLAHFYSVLFVVLPPKKIKENAISNDNPLYIEKKDIAKKQEST